MPTSAGPTCSLPVRLRLQLRLFLANSPVRDQSPRGAVISTAIPRQANGASSPSHRQLVATGDERNRICVTRICWSWFSWAASDVQRRMRQTRWSPKACQIPGNPCCRRSRQRPWLATPIAITTLHLPRSTASRRRSSEKHAGKATVVGPSQKGRLPIQTNTQLSIGHRQIHIMPTTSRGYGTRQSAFRSRYL